MSLEQSTMLPDPLDATFAEMMAAIDREKAARAAKMPTEADAVAQIQEAFHRLKELGWREAVYAPKTGEPFMSFEIGSTCIGEAFWMFHNGVDGPGCYWAPDAGDLWPARPTMWRGKTAAESEKAP